MCTLAYWHEPRWSSGYHGSNSYFAAFWTDLCNAGADVVLTKPLDWSVLWGHLGATDEALAA
jgi:hypothetical protein